MKICIYSTQVIPTRPDLGQYGGLESIMGLLCKYLDDQGHEVHLFASKNSYFSENTDGSKQGSERSHLYAIGLPGKTDPVQAWKHYWDDPRTRQILKDADIVCDASWGFYPYSNYNELKHICHVVHGPDPGFKTRPPIEKPNFIGVSHNHAKNLSEMSSDLTFRGVQNGIDLTKYPFKKERGDYYLWFGRIYPFKGTHRFIDICNKAKVKGRIAGGSFGDLKPYVEHIKQMVADSPYVTIEGKIGTDSVSKDGQVGVGVSHEKKIDLYQNAKAVVLPNIEHLPQPDGQIGQFIEPFGLIVPEANSCGVPTVVLPSGGWNETTIHGYNGFFANSDEEFIYYMKRVDEIKSENCRKMAEHFSYEKMGAEYLKLFTEIIEGRSW